MWRGGLLGLTTELDPSEQLVFTGPIPLGWLIVLGLVLGGAVVGLAVWEARRSGKRIGLLVLPLRLGAVAVVVWLLAAPHAQRTIERTEQKSVALFSDASASMDLVDPPVRCAGGRRWEACDRGGAGDEGLASADAAVASMAMARRHCEALAGSQRPGEAQTVGDRQRRTGECVRSALRAAVELVERSEKALSARYPEDAKELGRLGEDLRTQAIPRCEEVLADLAGEAERFHPDRQTRLAGLQMLLDELIRRGGRLAERLAEAEAVAAVSSGSGGASRKARVTGLLRRVENGAMHRIESRARVLRYEFDARARSVTAGRLVGTGPPEISSPSMTTSLSCVLRQAGRDAAGGGLQAVVILSDGAHNAPGDPLADAGQLLGVPVFIVPIGNTEIPRDVILHHVDAPRTVLQKDKVVVEATLDVHGCPEEVVTVELLEDEKVVDARDVQVRGEAFATRITFDRESGPAGTRKYEVRALPLDKEHTNVNNRGQTETQVVEETIRILLADEFPRWEYRFLRNLFDRDKRVEFDRLLIEPRNPRTNTPAEGLGFPGDADTWSKYRAVILGDIDRVYLPDAQLRMIEEFVARRGGTLIVLAGPSAMPHAYAGTVLEKMLPVVPGGPVPAMRNGYALQLTPEGRLVEEMRLTETMAGDERVWREATDRMPVQWLSPWSKARATATTWMRAVPRGALQQGASPSQVQSPSDERAFLCWQNYGTGRVVHIAAPVTYALRFREGDAHHHRFWGQLLRWAVSRDRSGGSKTLRIATDARRYARGEDVVARLTLRYLNGLPVKNASVPVEATQGPTLVATAEAIEDPQRPGVYTATFRDLPTGPVTLRAGGAQVDALLQQEGWTEPILTVVTVEPPGEMELRNVRCNLPLLTEIAAATRGSVLPPTALETVLEQLDLEPRTYTLHKRRPIWNRWIYLALFAGLVTVEWTTRKIAGMA